MRMYKTKNSLILRCNVNLTEKACGWLINREDMRSKAIKIVETCELF